MKAIQIAREVQDRKGQHVSVMWERPAKTLKSFEGTLVKRTTAHVRTGISFAKLGSVRDAIAAGERQEVGSLPWGQWRAGYEGLIIDHKDTEYVRLYPAAFANLKPRVEWILDGQPVPFGDVASHLQASELPKEKDETPDCFTLKAENVLNVI